MLGSAAATATLGYYLLYLIPVRVRIFLQVPFLVLFLSMTILDREPGWNLALLLGFSFTAGTLLNWSGADFARWLTWVLFLGLGSVSLAAAILLKKEFQKSTHFLFLLIILYLAGWVAFIFWDLPSSYRVIWIILGLLLFTRINAGILQRGLDLNREDSPIPLAIKLWVVLVQLFWLSGLI